MMRTWTTIGVTAIGGVLGLWLAERTGWIGSETKSGESGGCGCGCPGKKPCEDDALSFESEYSLPRVNPMFVEGAEDVYGAEEATSTVGGSPLLMGIPLDESWPPNPDDYQTHVGLGPSPVAYYDNYNDFMPEYRFPAPWTPDYSPTDPSRGADYTQYQTTTAGRF